VPSANLSGRPSPAQARHVLRDLDGKVGLILDGGACDVGITVKDIQGALRQDMHDCEWIPEILVHQRDFTDASLEQAPTTPGMKYRHYSPSVPVILLHTSSPPPDGTVKSPAIALLAALRCKTTTGPRPVKIGIRTPSDSQLGQCLLSGDGIQWCRGVLPRIPR
jgi:L-threonylcarbamoyladenylate synthase